MNLTTGVAFMSIRHPENHNLHLYGEDTYKGFPIMQDKGSFIREYLERLDETILQALEHYPRVFAFRVDLRFPMGFELSEFINSNDFICRFFDSLKAQIDHNRYMARQTNKYAHGCKVRYVWAKEIGFGGKPHYHLAILLNRGAFRTLGYFKSEQNNMFNRLEEAWASALRLPVEAVGGLVHIPDNPSYELNRGDRQSQDALFQRASYLCKAASKAYGNRQHAFGSSRG